MTTPQHSTPASKALLFFECLNLLLLGLLLLQSMQKSVSTSPSPTLLTLFDASDSIETLHAPNASAFKLQKKVHEIGEMVTVEDLIRHLHAHPELIPEVAIPTLKEMQRLQTELLANEEHLQQLETQLNQRALKLYQSLTPEDQFKIRQNRSRDSIEGIEAQYWKSLIEQLESQQ